MARGTLNIQKLSNPGSTIDVYQVLFEDLSGDTYSASMSREEVEEMLYEKLRLNMEVEDLDRYMDELDRNGHVLIDDVVTDEADLVQAGLLYLPQAG